MSEFDLWVPGRPIPKGRPRLGRRGRVFTPQTTIDYEAKIAMATKGLEQLDGPVEVYLEFSPDGLLIHAWEIDIPAVSKLRGDIDNYIKSALDGLQKNHFLQDGMGVIPQDKLVHRVTATKCP